MSKTVLDAHAQILRRTKPTHPGSELRKAYDAHDPLLPEFLTLAIQTFAEHELD